MSELRIRNAEQAAEAQALAESLKPDSFVIAFDADSVVLILKRTISRRKHHTLGRVRVFNLPTVEETQALRSRVERAVCDGAGWEAEAAT